MDLSTCAFLSVPIVTGAASAVWAPIAKVSMTGMSALNALTYGLVWLGMLAFRRDDPGLGEALRVLGWWPAVAYVGLSVVVCLSWFVAHRTTHVVWIAAAEMAWPVCVLAATWALAHASSLPVAPPAIGPRHLACAALIVAGVVGLAFWCEPATPER